MPTLSLSPLLGIDERQPPASPATATIATNLTRDARTGGWSTRLGFDRYALAQSGFGPFSALSGPVYSLHCMAPSSGGSARANVLFESGGTLYLVHEASGSGVLLRALDTGRPVPTVTSPCSTFVDVLNGCIVSNGETAKLIRPWPLGNSADSSNTISQTIRPFGIPRPPAPQPLPVHPMEDTTATTASTGSGQTSVWTPTAGDAIGGGGRWGLGLSSNSNTYPDKDSEFDYAVSFVSDTGSEGPLSSRGSISWRLPKEVAGLRYCVAVRIPPGPSGTAMRRIYRTQNYSSDSPAVGDKTLRFLMDIPNNVDELFWDAIRPTGQGADAPTTIVPSPKRWTTGAVFGGCLFVAGIDGDASTILYSNPFKIEQFQAQSYLSLPARGGRITALHAYYSALLVFREHGLSVITGDFVNGFTASTISEVPGHGSIAPHSIQTTPEGVIYLSLEGPVLLKGGQTGGAVISIEPIGDQILEAQQRIDPSAQSRAVSVWDALRGEYLLFGPADGKDIQGLPAGFAYTPGKGWTTREGFPVKALCSLPHGPVIFGSMDEDQPGLFVFTGGQSMGGTVVDNIFTPTARQAASWRSAWLDFGDPTQAKLVSSVTLALIAAGDVTLQVSAWTDYNEVPFAERSIKLQPAHGSQVPCYNTTDLTTPAVWTSGKVTYLRWDVGTRAATAWAFGFSTTHDIVLCGVSVELAATNKAVGR